MEQQKRQVVVNNSFFYSLVIHTCIFLVMTLVVLQPELPRLPLIIITDPPVEIIEQDTVSVDISTMETESVLDASHEIIIDSPEPEDVSVELEQFVSAQVLPDIPSGLDQEIELPESSNQSNSLPREDAGSLESAPSSPSAKERFSSLLSQGSQLGGSGGQGNGIFEQRLRAYGAQTGDVQVSLMWYTADDIDLHVEYSNGRSSEKIGWDYRHGYSGGMLDIDMNAIGPQNNQPIENIFWPTGSSPRGEFVVGIHFFRSWTGNRSIPVVLRVHTTKGTITKEYRVYLENAITPVFRFSN